MKIPLLKHRQDVHGSALVVGLVIATILGITLASYLVLAANQHRSMFRSQTWATSLSMTEAGVEEALAFINKNEGTSAPLTNWMVNYAFDGWEKSGNVYWKSNTADAAIGGYTVYITNLNNAPTIFAEGFAVWNPPGGFVPKPYYAAAGGQTVTIGSPTLVRRVFVQTKNTPIFPVPLAAVGQINLNGNNIATDSFDSGDPLYSINGKYPTGDLSKTKDNGTVVTLSTLIDSLSVGNADIKGKVKTGPSGTATIGSQGSVGSKAWVESGTNGIQPGYSADDMNIDFPSAVLPSGVTWSALPSANPQVINGVSYDRVFTGGNYLFPANIPLTGKVYIAPNAQVTLRVQGSVSLSGQSQIDISGTNSSLTIYMEGSSFSTAGNAGINNLSQNAMAFALYGLPTCTSISLAGNAAFSGTVYAPQADLSLGGGGNNTYDFVGASVSKTITMNGHFNFHYDENIARVGPSRGYVPTSWAEK